jgi:hypothetical protein
MVARQSRTPWEKLNQQRGQDHDLIENRRGVLWEFVTNRSHVVIPFTLNVCDSG